MIGANGLLFHGSIVALPSMTLLWSPKTWEDVTVDSLAFLSFIHPLPGLYLGIPSMQFICFLFFQTATLNAFLYVLFALPSLLLSLFSLLPLSLSLPRAITCAIADFLLLGSGLETRPVSPEVAAYLRSMKISHETMSSQQACGVFNIMNEEKRRVMACVLCLSPEEHTRYENRNASRFDKQSLSSKLK